MRVTLWLDPRRPWPELVTLAAQAEQAGFDAVRLTDPPDGYPSGRECWAAIGALASAIPRVRLEAVVRHDVGRHPAVVAKLASTVDQLSDGRLLLGLIPGQSEPRAAEAATVIRHLSEDHRTTFRGEYYQLEDAPLDPKPVQQPLPIMIMGGTAELAAKTADHWSIPNQHLQTQRAALEKACHETARDPSTVSVSVWSKEPPTKADEWVVPDSALGEDRQRWEERLRAIRALGQEGRD